MPQARRAPKKKGPVFRFEYVTSTVSLLTQAGQGDGIVAHVVNDSAALEHARVIIYHNTGAGAVLSTDSGVSAIVPTWQWSLAFTVPSSGEYWVRVAATSEVLIPKVSFERVQNGIWLPIVSYRPGDFAIFRLTPSRQRLW
jgi:hypothetical protein